MFNIRIGIVGCGMIGQQYGQSLCSLGAHVVATADPIFERAQRVAEFSGAIAYNDSHDLLEENEIDLLCVCTPTPFHYEPVLEAARHRRHIFCEKPLAETLQQGREMCRAVRKAGVTMGFGFKMRFEAIFAQAKSIIEAEEIGQPLYSIFSYFQEVPPPERTWYTDSGALRDMIPHAIDLSNWLLDRQPVQVLARLDYRLGFKGEDKVFLQMDYDNGLLASIHGGWVGTDYPLVAASDDIIFQVVGEKGYISGSRAGHLVLATNRGVERKVVTPTDGFTAELEAFLQALTAGEPPPVPAEAGLVTQAVIEAAQESSQTKQPVKIQVWA